MIKIVIVGQGGHSKVIRDIISTNKDMQVAGYLDDQYDTLYKRDQLYFGPVKSFKRLLTSIDDLKFIIGIGNNIIRKAIVQKIGVPEKQFITLTHSSAIVSSSARIGVGTVIMANTVINADAQIGNHAIINTGAIIEHDNRIGDFAHISPKATLTGAVHIEEGAHVGAGATVIPNISIGKWSVIGAGATVIHHIPTNCTAVGVPAKVITKEGVEIVEFNQ